MAAILLSFREGLEAALIVGIVLGYLSRSQQDFARRAVWLGVVAASILSLALAIALTALGHEFEGTTEQLFEGFTMLLAAVILTWMIFWMQHRGRNIKGELESKLRAAGSDGGAWPFFSLAFLAVLREGVELALFLTAAVFASSPVQTLAGAVLGLALACVAGWLLFSGARRLNLRAFFQVTSVLLLLFAAGMVGQAAHEFFEAGLLPALLDPVWDTAAWLPDSSLAGSLAKALLGYNDNPQLIQVLAYLAYLAAVLAALLLRRPRPVAETQPAR